MLMKVHPEAFVEAAPDVCTVPRETLLAWIAALRSGQYQQGSGELRTLGLNGATRHCCLGVLQVITQSPGEGAGENSFLGEEVGLSRGLQQHLAMANDGFIEGKDRPNMPFPSIPTDYKSLYRGPNGEAADRSSFKAIADWIEGYLLS